MKKLIFYAILLRLGFIIYGYFQDQHPVIKFTGKTLIVILLIH